jgi:glucose-6-phosphate 1-epimerase
MWNVENAGDNAATLSFTTSGQDAYFPYVAKATLRVALQGAVLHVALTTENRGDETFSLTQALHTYLNIGNIETVQVTGVEGLPRHVAGGGAVLPPQQGVLTFQAEHDVVYDTVPGLIKVAAPSINRTLVVQPPVDGEAVLWNPGPQKGAKLDIPAGAYASFLCVEPAHIDHPVTLEKGASQTLAMRLWQQPYKAE